MSVAERVRQIASVGELDKAAADFKEAVADELQSLDPALEISRTPYFNHSFAPDLLIGWSEAGEQRERPVFLRSHVWTHLLRDELTDLSEVSPLLIGLFDNGARELPDEVPAGADRSLVTEVAAVDVLRPHKEERSFATSALVRGGHGLLHEEAATQLEQGIDAAINAAAAGEKAETVQNGVALLGTWLDEGFSRRFELYTKLLWIGAGARLRDLGDEELGIAELSDSEFGPLLKSLLARSESLSSYLWAAIGGHLDADRLANLLGNTDVSQNLQDLVSANTESWRVRRALVQRDEEQTERLEDGWLIQNKTLAYQSGNAIAYFTGEGTRFNNWPELGEAVSWHALRSRSRNDDVTQVEISGTGARVIVIQQGEDAGPVAEKVDQLQSASDDSSEAVSVAEVKLPDGQSIRLEFGKGQAICLGDQDIKLNTLLDVVRRYLLPIPS